MARQSATIALAIAIFLLFHRLSETIAFALSWLAFALFPARLLALQEWRLMQVKSPRPSPRARCRPPSLAAVALPEFSLPRSSPC